MPVRFVVPDGGHCDNEGERWQEDCNTCRCRDRQVVCTREPCVGLQRGGQWIGAVVMEWMCRILFRDCCLVGFIWYKVDE